MFCVWVDEGGPLNPVCQRAYWIGGTRVSRGAGGTEDSESDYKQEKVGLGRYGSNVCRSRKPPVTDLNKGGSDCIHKVVLE